MHGEHDDHEETRERLLTRRDVDPATGCWGYRGATTSNGYGHMSFRGRLNYPHRIAAVIYLGFDIDSRLHVLHECDNPICFNPDHLRVGTAGDNMRDAAAKGRMVGKKLNAEQASHIKYFLGQGHTQRSLAIRYGVSVTAIGQIARGQTWRDVQPMTPLQEENDESGADAGDA